VLRTDSVIDGTFLVALKAYLFRCDNWPDDLQCSAIAPLKGIPTQEFIRELRGMNSTPHVAQNTTKRRSAVDERTTRHAGYDVSQRKRKRVEQSFGWMKMIGMLKKVKLRGIEKVGWLFTFTGALTTCADCET
jgi:hypothetical protein